MCVIEAKFFLTLSVLWVCRSELVKPKILLANGDEPRDIIHIIEGSTIILYCVGQEGYEIEMSVARSPLPVDKLETTPVNKTTIMFSGETLEGYISIYLCQYKRYSDYELSAYAHVMVHSLPGVKNFSCVSRKWEYLNCTWTSETRSSMFPTEHVLYYVKNGTRTLLCKNYASSNGDFCVWNNKHPLLSYQTERDAEHLVFFIKTCYVVFCRVETMVVEHRSTVILNPPRLTLESKSSHSATLKLLNEIDEDFILEYNLYYWYAGIPQPHSYLILQRSELDPVTKLRCSTIRLQLPCADTFYEVWVAVRLEGAGYLWSDNASTTFVTYPISEDGIGADGPTCKYSPIATPEVMLYLVDQFKLIITKQQRELRKKTNCLTCKASITNNYAMDGDL